ncbi:uncharacterized protein [Centruroides vittatus]|uniref:uncharacterized protein n=1 Tax=Centruroides vittatus TaxID=120091 RepID=UPI00350F23EE
MIYKGAIEPAVLYGVQTWGEAIHKVHNKRRLLAIQRKAAIRICRAYRTAPTDALLVLAKLKPIYLKATEIIWQGNLKKEHIGEMTDTEINKAINRGQLPNDKQLIDLIKKNDTEEVDKTTTIENPAQMETYRVNTDYEENPRSNKSLKVFTDGSKTLSGTGSDSRATLHILQNKKIATKIAQDLIAISESTSKNHNLSYNWIPAHKGHVGNEQADKLAKWATRTNTTKGYARIPLTEIRSQINKIMQNLWQQEWDSSETGRYCYKFFPTIQDRLQNKHFTVNFGVTQCLTRHGNFGEYLHRFCIRKSNLCDVDDSKKDDVQHYLFECTKFTTERENFQMKTLYAGFNWPPDEKDIVGNKTLFSALNQYIKDTKILINPYRQAANQTSLNDTQKSSNHNYSVEISEEEDADQTSEDENK